MSGGRIETHNTSAAPPLAPQRNCVTAWPRNTFLKDCNHLLTATCFRVSTTLWIGISLFLLFGCTAVRSGPARRELWEVGGASFHKESRRLRYAHAARAACAPTRDVGTRLPDARALVRTIIHVADSGPLFGDPSEGWVPARSVSRILKRLGDPAHAVRGGGRRAAWPTVNCRHRVGCSPLLYP